MGPMERLGPLQGERGDGQEKGTRVGPVLLAFSTFGLFQHQLQPSSNVHTKQRAPSIPKPTSAAGVDDSYGRDRRKGRRCVHFEGMWRRCEEQSTLEAIHRFLL